MTSKVALFGLAICGAMSGCSASTEGTSAGASSSSGSGGAGGAYDLPDCRDGWCLIPAGSFVKGSPPDEYGHHENSERQANVTLSRSFVMMQYEITREEWAPFAYDPTGEIPHDIISAECVEPDCPVANLTWFEMAAYSNWLSEREGLDSCYELLECTGEVGHAYACERMRVRAPSISECAGYRMPTEAEWEYAYRAGTTTAFYPGDIWPQLNGEQECEYQPSLGPIAWFRCNSGNRMHPKGQMQPNPWGLYDMAGNNSEWTHSVYRKDYTTLPPIDPSPDGETLDERIAKGGGFNSWVTLCRAASHLAVPWYGHGFGGRLVRTLRGGEAW
ncbi:MAG: formylglycine-generating enzyme family protein [Polyangiaceae bacterium]|nr:formylglycine-generating enzyme family protein [Polyangiaceae bacterium]